MSFLWQPVFHFSSCVLYHGCFYRTRNTQQGDGVEELNTACGVAECCIAASRPQPKCCIILVQYRNNHGITVLFSVGKGKQQQQQGRKISAHTCIYKPYVPRAITVLVLYGEYSTVGSFDSPTHNTISVLYCMSIASYNQVTIVQ